MATNSFKLKKFEDFEIVNANGNTVGHVRVKPSGILWAPKDAKAWYGLPLERVAAIFEAQGKKQKK
jgi:hypothetical protein